MKHTVETKNAYLPSSGYNGKKWTKHVYAYSQPLTVTPRKGDPIRGVGHYFRCLETDAVRQWGFDRSGKDIADADDLGN